MTLKLYSIQVAGIKCTNCAGKIERGLTQNISQQEGLSKVTVNIIQQKVNITTSKEQTIDKAIQILKNLNFPPIGSPILISGGNKSERIVTFVYDLDDQSQKIETTIKNIIGVTKISHSIEGQQIKLHVTYNCQIIKGRQIADQIAKIKPKYKIINQWVDSFRGAKNVQKKGPNIIVTSLLCAFFLIFNMILPFTGHWHDMITTYPQELKIFSIAVIVNILLTLYVMIRYGKHFILNAFKNYVNHGQTNMQTLIALGSLSAFCLFLFFIGRYTIQLYNDRIQDISDAIMEINQSLTMASILLLVVTIGKTFQDKIKRKIDRITDQIFPESTLFKDMMVEFIQLKNRNLVVKDKRNYDVTLLQKNDVICLKAGMRLLVDVTVLSGQIKAIQSAMNGSQDLQIVNKGGRIQSGSIIKQNNQALVIIENVFQQSILIEIGTQIKLAQNQEQGGKSGIQQVCKTIANYFVKGVIILSILTAGIWAALLYTDLVEVPICKVCWIVQRGIGVLVASCPCALGLAVPSVIAIILNLATKSGILIRNNSVFDKMKRTNIISFDKTGTLFTRIQQIEQFIEFKDSQMELKSKWEIISLIEKEIKHPLAEILYKEAFNKSGITGTNYNYLLLSKPQVDKNGLISSVCSKSSKKPFQVLIGNKNILKKFNIQIPNYVKKSDGSTQLFLCVNGVAELVMIINTHSNLRPQARDVVRKIQKLNKEVHILSGDSRQSVEKLATYLKIPHKCLHPQQSAFNKMEWIKQIQAGDKKGVLMVGDGLNDIPCLQEAAIGVSINAKSQLNINAADVVILSENLHKILAFIRLIKRGNQFIIINLLWAFGYNIAMMPAVAGAFYGLGFHISPMWSSVAMSLSSIIVVLFSQLLLCFHYDDSLQKGYVQKYQGKDTIATRDLSHPSLKDLEESLLNKNQMMRQQDQQSNNRKNQYRQQRSDQNMKRSTKKPQFQGYQQGTNLNMRQDERNIEN